MAARLDDLASQLGHHFKRQETLAQALTHPSTYKGRGGHKAAPYERLEFLGDRVLGLVIADMLFTRFPDEAEGALARRFTALVRKETCARVSENINLGPYLTLSKGEEEAGGRQNQGILADACEAIIGALYADGGFEVARSFITSHWECLMEESLSPPKDAKTTLQEWAQGKGKQLPKYETVEVAGPPHDPIFSVQVSVEGVSPEVAKGASKRAAEQVAAQAMLEKVKK